MDPTLQSIFQPSHMHLHRIQKCTFHWTEATCLHGFFPSWQRCAWWTVVPTARASVVCVSARKAGLDQNVSRGTVTHAALTTVSAERASVTATRAGRGNTAPSVSHSDTNSTLHVHTLDRRTQTTEEIHLWADLKGQHWSVNVSVFRAVSSRSRHTPVAAYVLRTSTFACHTSDEYFWVIFSVFRSELLCFLLFNF